MLRFPSLPAWKRKSVRGVLLGLAAILCTSAKAQEDTPREDRTEQAEAKADPADEWTRLRQQLTEVLVEHAVAGDSQMRQFAGNYLKNHPPKDERWDQVVREMLSSRDVQTVSEGIQHLPETKIPVEEKYNLATVAMARLNEDLVADLEDQPAWWDPFLTRQPSTRSQMRAAAATTRLVEFLQKDPERFRQWVLNSLNQDEPLPVYHVVLRHLPEADLEIAQRLLALSQSRDTDTAALASLTLNHMLESQESEREGAGAAQSDVDVKYLTIAERLLSRADKDNNGRLDKSESTAFIMDITPADIDQDGSITVEEYARWLQSRTAGRD